MDKIQRATEIHRSMTPHQMALRIVELEDIAEIVGQSASERSKRITELQDALEIAEEAVRAKHSPGVGNMVPDGCNVEPMTLDEAITHANEKSMGDSQCAAQHAQLAKWLTDYRAMLAAAPKPKDE